jgi:hypothetical protein
LEVAAHDVRLEQVPGIGPRRAAMFRATVGAVLQQRICRPAPSAVEPPVSKLRINHLEADKQRLTG